MANKRPWPGTPDKTIKTADLSDEVLVLIAEGGSPGSSTDPLLDQHTAALVADDDSDTAAAIDARIASGTLYPS